MLTTLRRCLFVTLACASSSAWAQPVPADQEAKIRDGLRELNTEIETLFDKNPSGQKLDARLRADVAVYAKGVEWCLLHNEFYVPKNSKDGKTPYARFCLDALNTGKLRVKELTSGKPAWTSKPGSTIRGYVSRVDGSVQPYSLLLPKSFADAKPAQRWPLHLVLHGRGGERNEVRFIAEHDNKSPKEEPTWIQLDVFGRTDNAYRWAGETDVFEALADVSRRYRIDDHRITLRGFSMGGAGSWHLGLHHPSSWSSVGPGAGFIDFYKYQKQTALLPEHQHKTLRIYDSINYALNMANVPLCTYGGELDEQLVASTAMVARAKELDVPCKLLIGPGVGHKFHPETEKEFMAFHVAQSQIGRPAFPGAKSIRFITHTLKYNRCEWLTIEELEQHYEPALVEGGVTSGLLKLKTSNVAALQLARDVADEVELDGQKFELQSAADNLLPGVFFEKDKGKWEPLSYDESITFGKNPNLRKRHNLQGPIDDAFMEPFVCVRATGKPLAAEHQTWADASLTRFDREFSKSMRGKIRVVDDAQLNDDDIADRNLILFGDPSSNSVLKRVSEKLPVKWTGDSFQVSGKTFSSKTHGVCFIYPNPLNPSRYVVINSGHTMHDKDFIASNAWLFPKLGDVAVINLKDESTVWAGLFDENWELKP